MKKTFLYHFFLFEWDLTSQFLNSYISPKSNNWYWWYIWYNG